MRKRGTTDVWSQLQGIKSNAPVLKATKARLLLALAAAEGAKVVRTDTKQAYLYGDVGDDVVYIRPPDWWPEPIPEEHVFLLLKSIYGTRQAALRRARNRVCCPNDSFGRHLSHSCQCPT